MKRWIAVPALALALGAGASAGSGQEYASPVERVELGRRMFMEQGCYGCHTVKNYGTPIGPDLSRVGGKHAESYLRNWLRDPAMQRPAAHMPKLELTEAEIAVLAAFLTSLE